MPAASPSATSRSPRRWTSWRAERPCGLAPAQFAAHIPSMSSARTAFWRTNADDSADLRRRFWRKLRVAFAQVPFAEDLLAAYYCAFDRQTPLPVKASLVGALAY